MMPLGRRECRVCHMSKKREDSTHQMKGGGGAEGARPNRNHSSRRTFTGIARIASTRQRGT